MDSSGLIAELKAIVSRYDDVAEPDVQDMLTVLQYFISAAEMGGKILSALAESVQSKVLTMIYRKLMREIAADVPPLDEAGMEALLKRIYEKINAEGPEKE